MKRYSTASVLALTIMAGQAWADVTPQQVWDEFEAYMQSFGYEMTATEISEGSSLVITDLSMTVPIPEEEGAAIRIVMPQMTYADNGDGSVTVTYPAVSDITVDMLDDGEKFGEIVVAMTQSNFAVTVSGSEGDMTYTYGGDSLAMELVRLFGDGEEITRDMLSATLSMGPLSGASHVVRADGMRSIEQDMSLGTLAYNIMFNDPDSGDAGTFVGQLTGLASFGTTVLPEVMDYDDPTAMFTSGGSVDVVLRHTGGKTDFSVTEDAGTTTGQFTSTGGEFGFALSESELTYAVSATGQTIALSGPEIPLPINFSASDIGFALTMPLMPGDAPQDASLSIILGEFATTDMLWNIFDPGQMLPREPATIALNLDAKVSPLVSLLDTDKMEELAMTGGMPGELNALTISDLVVQAVGAVITGSGAFTFDNTDLATFDGVPRPEGKLELNVAGANGLIDTLIAMGLMGEEDAMGARMMLSMFTVPGDAPDTATSTIEINAQGHVLANGQRIQ
ncbi:DUF2125 domain-containing protein [Maliponia aquimaris]|uniref:DUF2125 domain-containing protein n=1 Tax=Maliponia aquimaris TaxID=1673631 RepID=A0A238KC94_9RHOB|nr:DUF2125 domain-containing protein [Maliponia aquimaris]SMX40440.1 hypothetical protein MAA8898_02137 [Maliponia aquimaris]